MDKKKLETIDKDESGRIDEFSNRWNIEKSIDVEDIFKHKNLINAINNDNALIGSFDEKQILSSVPFYSAIFVQVCPKCSCVKNPDLLKPYLNSNVVIPILTDHYSEFAKQFVMEIIRYPHISFREFDFYRFSELWKLESQHTCNHCVQKRIQKIKDFVNKKGGDDQLIFMTNQIENLLRPYAGRDINLLDMVVSAILNDNSELLHQILDLSYSINTIRSAQAFHSACSMPFDVFNICQEKLISSMTKSFEKDIQNVRNMVTSGLSLSIPKEMSVDKYLEIVLRHQQKIRETIDFIIERASSGTGEISYSTLIQIIAEVNDDIRKAQQTKRYTAYKAAVGFASGNKTMIAFLLLAGALGLTGNFFGCGASTLAGPFLQKFGKIKTDKSINELQDIIRQSVEPATNTLIAEYLGMSIEQVQVWRVWKELDLSS